MELDYSRGAEYGPKTAHKYGIQFYRQPSNLGKGELLYFICASSGRKCRIHYLTYDAPTFKCRQAYRNRLYFEGQQSGRYDRYNNAYWRLDKTLTRLREDTSA